MVDDALCAGEYVDLICDVSSSSWSSLQPVTPKALSRKMRWE